jgi:FolB domain-containing protein
MSDRVFIEGLELYCVIGVHEVERRNTRRVRIDLEIDADCRAAGESDDVADALDYHAVAKSVQRTVEGSSFRLLEALAESIATTVLSEFPAAAGVRVRVAKPGMLRWVDSVGVEIARRRPGLAL